MCVCVCVYALLLFVSPNQRSVVGSIFDADVAQQCEEMHPRRFGGSVRWMGCKIFKTNRHQQQVVGMGCAADRSVPNVIKENLLGLVRFV